MLNTRGFLHWRLADAGHNIRGKPATGRHPQPFTGAEVQPCGNYSNCDMIPMPTKGLNWTSTATITNGSYGPVATLPDIAAND